MCELSTEISKASIFSWKVIGLVFLVLFWLSLGGCATQSKAPTSSVVKTEPSHATSSSAKVDTSSVKPVDDAAPKTAPVKNLPDEKMVEKTQTVTKKKEAPKKIVKKKVETASKQVKQETPSPVVKKAATNKPKVATKKKPKKAIPVAEETTVSKSSTAEVEHFVEGEAPKKTAAETDLVEFSSLDQLPLVLSSDWGIDVVAPPGETKKACLLSHKKENVFDGYEKTTISVFIGIDKVWFKSKSNLDLSYPDTGYQVIDIDGNLLQTNTLQLTQRPDAAYVDASIASLPLQSTEMVIKTGFWPSWPVTETQSFSVSVRDAKALTSALQTCASLLN